MNQSSEPINGSALTEKETGYSPIIFLVFFVLCAFCALVAGFATGTAALSFSKLSVVAVAVAVVGAGALVYRGAKKYFANLIAAIVAAWVIGIAAFMFYGIENKPLFIIIFGLAAVVAAAIFFAATGQMTWEKAILLIIAAGFVMRLGYVLYTNVDTRQHDVEGFVSGSSGHGGYILWFFENWRLPDIASTDANAWQFYQPPLHHFLSAVWMKLQTLCGISLENAEEGIQYLTLFYSTCVMLLSKRVFETLGLKKTGLLTAMGIVAFAPTFIILSGSLNNDILSIAFVMAAMLAVLKWNRSGRLCHLLQTALFIGLGMATKTSAALIAVPTALLMLSALIRSEKKLKIIGQYALFACVVFPLGLWWEIYNSVRFKVPFMDCFGVPMLGVDSFQYVGNHSFFERFMPFFGFGNTEFFRWSDGCEYNVWSGLFKSSAFDEYGSRASDGFLDTLAPKVTPILFYLLLAVCILAFMAMLYYLFVNRKAMDADQRLFLVMFYAVTLASYLVFCWQYPHTCTMSIRYATPLVIIGAFFYGKCTGEFFDRMKVAKGRVGSVCTVSFVSLAVIAALFALFSILTYTFLGVQG